MGLQNTFTQIESFLFVAYNGWRGALLVSSGRQWETIWEPLKSSNLEISIVDPKPALDKAVPFREKYPELGHMKGHLYFFLQVHNKTNTHVLWFFVKKQREQRPFVCPILE